MIRNTENTDSKAATFELNGILYETTEDTLRVLRTIIPSAKATGDSSAVIAMISLGVHAGLIVQTG